MTRKGTKQKGLDESEGEGGGAGEGEARAEGQGEGPGSRAPSFEESLARLEGIVRDLERGELPLDDAMKRYEEGVALARACRARLEAIEGRIAILLEDGALEDVESDDD
ncbi:MAG: exodeoxyribonuclease VII small subunit [Thermoplasmatota archaeon]